MRGKVMTNLCICFQVQISFIVLNHIQFYLHLISLNLLLTMKPNSMDLEAVNPVATKLGTNASYRLCERISQYTIGTQKETILDQAISSTTTRIQDKQSDSCHLDRLSAVWPKS